VAMKKPQFLCSNPSFERLFNLFGIVNEKKAIKNRC